MQKKSLFSRIASVFRFADTKPQLTNKHDNSIGSAGTEISGGIYSEDYLGALTGTDAAEMYDKMRRSDTTIKMCLSSVKNPILGAKFDFEPASEDEEHIKHADFLKFIYFDDLARPFKGHIKEALTHVDFGHAIFEMIHKKGYNKEWGDYIGINRFGWRSPKTITEWVIDPDTGDLAGIKQTVSGDYAPSKNDVFIPGKFLMAIVNELEGDNYSGISDLRPCYGAYFRKNLYLKLQGIGAEKSITMVIGTVPKGQELKQQAIDFEEVLQKFICNESNYIKKPEGWGVEIINSQFDPEKLSKIITREENGMVKSFLANFLNLGQDGGGGAFALSNDLSDFFLQGIQHKADNICEAHNISPVKDLIKYNFGPQDKYPKMICTGIQDKAGKELAEIVETLVKAGALTPDPKLERYLRAVNKLPEKEEIDASMVDPNSPTPTIKKPDVNKAEKENETDEKKQENAEKKSDAAIENETPNKQFDDNLTMADSKPKTPKALIEKSQKGLRVIMQFRLRQIRDKLIKDTIRNYNKLSDTKKVNATKGVEAGFSAKFKDDLFYALVQVGGESYDQVKKEIPGLENIQFADDETLSRLPKKTREYLKRQAELLTETMSNDLEKNTFFQFSSSIDSTQDENIIAQDMREAGDKYIDGAGTSVASGNAASFAVNKTRQDIFAEPEVLEQIESFTFVNPDPQVAICKQLAGKSFDSDDSSSLRYQPPLHHNCKSYVVSNLKGVKGAPKDLAPLQESIKKSGYESITLKDENKTDETQ